MPKVFNTLVHVLTLLVAVQFFLAGQGSATASFGAHRALGFVILLLALATGVVAVAGGAHGTTRRLAGALVLLVLLQPFVAGLGQGLIELGGSATAGGMVFGLHAVNGLLIMAVLGAVLKRSRQVTAAREVGPSSGLRESGV